MMLLDDGRMRSSAYRQARLPARERRVQWNPADHLCMAGQVLCRQAPVDTWTLSGEIHAIEQQHYA